MDRSTLIKLLLEGMECPQPDRRLWVVKCYKVTRHTGKLIEVNEYHGSALAPHCKMEFQEMLHVGSSMVNLTTRKATDHKGESRPKI